ncbi:hypothetical protein FOZ60_011824 [Perkinsus olseni]|uniref:Uncharacterized protein n=1 Tax=Perkinsus olseni TaxID=32597 RepID=A0A7J6PMB0_PEROL|nr:hypothetical protein FOZ60_011824 [Perkinsus olseni]
MCADLSDGSLVLIDCDRGSLHRVHWDSPDAFITLTTVEGHRIRLVSEEDIAGGVISVCCCGDGFVHGLWEAEFANDREQIIRIAFRNDVPALWQIDLATERIIGAFPLPLGMGWKKRSDFRVHVLSPVIDSASSDDPDEDPRALTEKVWGDSLI